MIVFFRLVETMFQENPSFQLVETQEEKKAVNKRILFTLNKSSHSTSWNKGFVKKIGFHYSEKLLSSAGIII